jgi:hypothetical protein
MYQGWSDLFPRFFVVFLNSPHREKMLNIRRGPFFFFVSLARQGQGLRGMRNAQWAMHWHGVVGVAGAALPSQCGAHAPITSGLVPRPTGAHKVEE